MKLISIVLVSLLLGQGAFATWHCPAEKRAEVEPLLNSGTIVQYGRGYNLYAKDIGPALETLEKKCMSLTKKDLGSFRIVLPDLRRGYVCGNNVWTCDTEITGPNSGGGSDRDKSQRPDAPVVVDVPDEPSDDEPISDDPVSDDPVSDDPVSDDPVSDDPVSDDPVSDDPVSDDPVSDEPVN